MGRLTPADASRVVAFVDATSELDADEPIPQGVLGLLQELIPSHLVEHIEFDAAQTLRSYVATAAPPEGSGEAMWAINAGIIAGHRQPQDGAARLSDLLPPLRKRPGWYFDQIVAIGFRDILKLWLPARPLRSILMLERDEDFSVRDRQMLELLREHLAAIRHHAANRRALRHHVPSLSPREAEILGLVARGWTNEEIAKRLRVAPGTVAKHLENAFVKLDVHSRAEAVAIVGLYLRDPAGPFAPVAGSPRGARGGNGARDALTPRQVAVLTWAARGRRNDQIAEILYITPRTVAKHLQLAYDKLGARSRMQAVAILRELARPPRPSRTGLAQRREGGSAGEPGSATSGVGRARSAR
jgi:DNA-binding CsgD family transcriptional regulator